MLAMRTLPAKLFLLPSSPVDDEEDDDEEGVVGLGAEDD